MGKLARSKKRDPTQAIYPHDLPAFAQLPQMTNDIAWPFLKQRVEAYIEGANLLVEELTTEVPPEQARDQIEALQTILNLGLQ